MSSSFQTKEGYLVIPIKIWPSSTARHHLYVKKNQTRESCSAKPSNRTLFVVNVPPYVQKECLERLFGDVGAVASVFVHMKPTPNSLPDEATNHFSQEEDFLGYKVAYVVFKHEPHLQKALNPKFVYRDSFYDTNHGPVTGIEKWCSEYGKDYINADDLQKEINTFMTKHDSRQEDEKHQSKVIGEKPDEEGWVTITKHSKTKGVPRTLVKEKQILSKEKKKRKYKELLNFYAFQQRETKKNQIEQLREKFEEDKAKIQEMKAARKFRPY